VQSGVIFQKIEHFIATAVRTSNPTKINIMITIHLKTGLAITPETSSKSNTGLLQANERDSVRTGIPVAITNLHTLPLDAHNLGITSIALTNRNNL
jgi:hypothetical protein